LHFIFGQYWPEESWPDTIGIQSPNPLIMSITPGHLVLNTLQDLSRAVSRAGARDPSKDFTRVIPNPSKAYALGGLGIATSGRSTPGPIRYGAITITPQQVGPIVGHASGVHPAVGRAYDNPGVRFGDRSLGSSRPLSADGAQSFHFNHDHHSKTSPILEMIKAAHGGRRHTNSKATDHLLYIERDGAAEKIAREKEYPGYDPDVADDLLWELKRDAAGRSAASQQDYLERPGAVERTPIKNLSDEELDALEYASFGTIGDTIDERKRFWDLVDQIEEEPRGDTVTLKFADHPEWWDLAIANIETAPRPLQAKLKQQQASGEIKDIKLASLPTDKAFAIHQWTVALYPEAPIDVAAGRGGRVQNRIIAELPWELEGRERVEIVRNFTNKLAERGLPFSAVIHAPDKNNDRRNYHVHIVYYDRPAARMRDPKNFDGPEVWNFEIQEEKRFPNRHRRIVYPYLQNKLREANGQAWIPMLREHWAQVSNEVMERVGIVKRYDARSYEAMGIQLDPLKHIRSKTFNKERKGELTEDGVALGRRQWQVMQDRLVANHEKRARHRRRILKEKTDKAKQVLGAKSPYKDIALKEVARLTDLVDRVGARLSTSELIQDLGRLVTDRVVSRPKLIIHADRQKQEKSQDRSKSKGGQGHGDTQAPEAKKGAAQPVGRAAKDSMDFLLEVYGRGLQIDRRNQVEVNAASSKLTSLLKRLDHMIADPTRHPLDRRTPGFIDLNVWDPAPEVIAARRKETMDRVVSRMDDYVEAALPNILAKFGIPSPDKPATSQENTPQGSTSAKPTEAQPAKTTTAPAARDVSRDPSARPAANAGSGLSSAESSPTPARSTPAEPTPAPEPARPMDPADRPPRTRFRPEPFYKPKQPAAAPAATQDKTAAATSAKSPEAKAVIAPQTAPATNGSASTPGNKTAGAVHPRSPVEPNVTTAPRTETTTATSKPACEASTAVLPGSTKASAPSERSSTNSQAAALSTDKAASIQPPRPVAKPVSATTKDVPPQTESKREAAPTKPAAAQGSAQSKAPSSAQAACAEAVRPPVAPPPQTDRAPTSDKPTPTPAAAVGKPDKNPAAAKAPAPIESGFVRPTGETQPAAKPPKEKAEIRVGTPLSPGAPKMMEPIRIEGKKPPKKPKRAGKTRDEGPGL
jgi:MobA/MobL family